MIKSLLFIVFFYNN